MRRLRKIGASLSVFVFAGVFWTASPASAGTMGAGVVTGSFSINRSGGFECPSVSLHIPYRIGQLTLSGTADLGAGAVPVRLTLGPFSGTLPWCAIGGDLLGLPTGSVGPTLYGAIEATVPVSGRDPIGGTVHGSCSGGQLAIASYDSPVRLDLPSIVLDCALQEGAGPVVSRVLSIGLGYDLVAVPTNKSSGKETFVDGYGLS
ncbi:MAG TPA: hypothetical protein VHD81_11595 [Mycobacteriales bacterium]|nr:hypothetical protein [Mycobacteriales bacterium]